MNPTLPIEPATAETADLRRRRMFLEHLGLVSMVVTRMFRTTAGSAGVLERADLLQAGAIGLLEAIDRFDESRGARFSTFAVARVRGAIQDQLRAVDWMSRSTRKRDRDADARIQGVEEERQHGASLEEIASRLGMAEEEVRHVLGRMADASPGGFVPLDEAPEQTEALATDETEDPSEIAGHQHTRELLLDAIEGLSERDRLVVTLYYYEELTFKEIGRVLHLSETRVFQIHAQVLQHFRSLLQDDEAAHP